MTKRNQERPNYLENPDFSFYDVAKDHQEYLHTKAVAKVGKTEQLPHELAKTSHSHAKQFLEETKRAFKTHCKENCSYCCHQPATVFAFEAIQLASVVRNSLPPDQLATLIQTMRARVNGLDKTSVAKNINNKTACPLLSNDKCSVYENRPLTCRLAHSFSVKRCRLSFENDRFKVQIPVSLELQSGISGIIEAMYEQLPKENLDGNLYELCSAVLAALANPDSATKWAKGDRSVFNQCIKDDT